MKAIDQLEVVMKTLRNQCPWDKKQTLDTILMHTLEEVYELADAIQQNNKEEINHELGDLLLHLFFYAEITRDLGWYGLEEIASNLITRLVNRHPHIYGELQVANADEVAQNWDKIKAKKESKHLLEGIPRSMPAMMQAQLIQKKMSKHGFDWSDIQPVFDKLQEEISELQTAIQSGSTDEQFDEYGDVIFSVINLGRKLRLDAEQALYHANNKFTQRIRTMEKLSGQSVTDWDTMNEQEMDDLWEKAKSHISATKS